MRRPGRYDGVARPIVTYGSNPVLHRPCAPVTEFGEPLRRLLLDMFASMEAADGVGLAANQIGEEGCLSVPGPYAELPRAFRARVDGVDVKGDPMSIEATGMAARCLQHEMDHLDGTVYVDLLTEEHRERLLAEAAGPGGDLPA